MDVVLSQISKHVFTKPDIDAWCVAVKIVLEQTRRRCFLTTKSVSVLERTEIDIWISFSGFPQRKLIHLHVIH